MKYPFRVDYRVAFRDVDLHNVLHHSNYFYYCEKGRVELLRSVNLPYKKVVEMGISLMLVECNLKFSASVRFDEILNINLGVDKIGKSSFKILYLMEVDEKIVSEGYTHHVCVSLDSGKPTRIPEKLLVALESFQIQGID